MDELDKIKAEKKKKLPPDNSETLDSLMSFF